MRGPALSVAVAGPPGMGKTRLSRGIPAPRAPARLPRAARRAARAISAPRRCSRSARCCRRWALPRRRPGPHALGEWFERLATEQPLLLFIDDWQWADDASQPGAGRLRRALAGRAADRAVDARDRARGRAGRGMSRRSCSRRWTRPTAAQAVAAQLPGADPFVVGADRALRRRQSAVHRRAVPLGCARRQRRRLERASGGAGWINS